MGEVRVNLTNFVTVGVMAFVAIYIINRGLAYFGQGDWQT